MTKDPNDVVAVLAREYRHEIRLSRQRMTLWILGSLSQAFVFQSSVSSHSSNSSKKKAHQYLSSFSHSSPSCSGIAWSFG